MNNEIRKDEGLCPRLFCYGGCCMSLAKILNNLDITKVKAPSGLTYGQELVGVANLLSNCIQSKIHQRTMQHSISIADLADIKVEGNRMSITLKIENSIRPSIFKKWNKSDANVFWLLNDGYVVKKNVWFKNIPNFGYRQASNWIADGIRDFNSKNKLGLQLSEQKNVIRPLLYYGRVY